MIHLGSCCNQQQCFSAVVWATVICHILHLLTCLLTILKKAVEELTSGVKGLFRFYGGSEIETSPGVAPSSFYLCSPGSPFWWKHFKELTPFPDLIIGPCLLPWDWLVSRECPPVRVGIARSCNGQFSGEYEPVPQWSLIKGQLLSTLGVCLPVFLFPRF